MIIDFVSKYFYYLFLALILLTVIQRKYRGEGDQKRFAVLMVSIFVFVMYIGALGIRSKNLDQSWLLLPFLVDLSLVYVLRKKLFIFKTTCRSCGKKLAGTDILYIDSNLCNDCSEASKLSKNDEADKYADGDEEIEVDEESSDGTSYENTEKD